VHPNSDTPGDRTTKVAATDRLMQTAPRSGARGLRRYLIAAVLIRLADEGARVALVLIALQRTNSAAVGGLLVAALLVPQVVAAPAVGLLTDRARQPRWLLTASVVGFAASLAAVALLLGRVPLPVVVAVLLLGGCCGPSLTGGLTSQLSRLVPDASLPRAFGADSLTYNLSGIAGPAVAAIVSGAAGAATATLTLAGSAAAGALVLAILPLPVRDRRPKAQHLSLTAGLRALLAGRVLGTVTVASSLCQIGLGALPVIAAVLTSRQHQPAATGWLMTAIAVGALIGSLLWTWRPVRPARTPMTVMVALIGVGVPLAVAAATTSSLALTAILFGISGVSLGPFAGALFTTRRYYAPEELQAQVFTISAGLRLTMAAAGATIGGTLAGLPSATQLIFAASIVLFAGGLGALALVISSKSSSERAELQM
jgi:MFS family permease